MREFDPPPTAIVSEAKSPYRVLARITCADRVSYKTMVTVAEDYTPAPGAVVSFSKADTDWGERDSLGNVPRAKQPSWVRSLSTIGSDEGDR